MSKKSPTFFIALWLLGMALPFVAMAQEKNWHHYTTQNSGLLGNNILATTTDKRGNIWVGTDMGLCSLKGTAWTDYSQFNEKLKGQFVNCLTIDNNQDLWIGTDDYGVIKFNGRYWTEYTDKTKELKMKFIREISIDKNNVKWIGVTLGGLVRYNDIEWYKYSSETTDKLLSDFILCVAIDRGNRKWIGTNDGLSVYNDHVWRSYTTENSPLPHNIIPAIAMDKNNVKWLGTLAGLVRYDDKEWKIYDDRNTWLPSIQINDLAFDKNGMLWIVTAKGVALFDCQSNWLFFTHENSPLPKEGITNIVVDAQGRKWIGTTFHGLYCYSGQGVKGRVTDETGEGVEGVVVRCGDNDYRTDANGYYQAEVATGSSIVITPSAEGHYFEPASRSLSQIRTFTFQQDFTVYEGQLADAGTASDGDKLAGTSGNEQNNKLTARGSSKEKVSVTPYLQAGYITIEMESAVAEVEFVNSRGISVRTIPQYKNGARIPINKMAKDNYMLYIRTKNGEKSLRFNLK